MLFAVQRPHQQFHPLMRQSILFVRPFHIVHQLMVLFLVYSIHMTTAFTVWLSGFLVMPLLFVVNDYLHMDEDQTMGRQRFFLSIKVARNDVAGISIFLLITIVLLTAMHGVIAVLFLTILIIVASLYGYYKHKKQTIMTYAFRLLSGTTLYLFYAANFGLRTVDVWFGVFVGLADLSAHFAGDLRDFAKDQTAHVQTLPVRFGKQTTYKVMIATSSLTIGLLVICNLFFTIPMLRIYTLLFILLQVTAWGAYYYNIENYKWQHACFHGAKVFSYFYLAIFYLQDFVLLLWTLPIFLLWLISYKAYLWADYNT